jgi:hypothetical protein
MTAEQTRSLDELRRRYPVDVAEEAFAGRLATLRVSDPSGTEFLIDERGQVIDPSFVIADYEEALRAGIPEDELD